MKLKINLGLSLLSFCLVQQAYAELDVFDLSLTELSKVEVATKTPITLFQAPSVVSVITREDIAKLSANTLPDVLKSVAGFNVVPSTLNRMNPTFTIRGIYTGNNPQVLFLLNGSRIQGSFYAMGLDKLSHWPLQSIKRIEIIRGPGSALYGADAFAGVVNIITHDKEPTNNSDIGVKFGANNTKEAWLNTQYTLKNGAILNAYFNHFYQNEDTDRRVNLDAQSTLDGLFGTQSTLAPYHLSDKLNTLTYGINYQSKHWLFSIDANHSRDKGIGAGAAQALDNKGYDDHDMVLSKISYQNNTLVEGWDSQLTFEHIYSKTKAYFYIFPAGAALPVGDDGNLLQPHSGKGCTTVNIANIGCLTQFPEGVRGNPGSSDHGTRLKASFNYLQWPNHQLRFSLGWRTDRFKTTEQKNFGPGVLDRETLKGENNPHVVSGSLTDVTDTEYAYATNSNRQVSHILAQDIWQINPKITITSGIRFDHYSDFGSTINPRLSVVWQTTDSLTSRIFYATAFRAPSFSELGAKNNPIQLGNSELAAEEIETWELAFSHQTGNSFIQQLNFYHFNASNMIKYVAQPNNGLSVAKNSDTLNGKGFEYELSYLPKDSIKFSTSFSLQDTEDGTTHSKQPFIPRKKLNASFHWLLSDHSALNVQYLKAYDRPRAASDDRDPLSNYQTLDINLVYKFNQVQLKLSAQNATNEQYVHASSGSIPQDYPAYDRRFYLSMQYLW